MAAVIKRRARTHIDSSADRSRPREMLIHKDARIGMIRGAEVGGTIATSKVRIDEALHLARDRHQAGPPTRIKADLEAGAEEEATKAAVKAATENPREILRGAVWNHCRDAEVESRSHAPMERRMMQRQVIAVAAHQSGRDQDQELRAKVRTVLKLSKTKMRRGRAEDRNGILPKINRLVHWQVVPLRRAACLVC